MVSFGLAELLVVVGLLAVVLLFMAFRLILATSRRTKPLERRMEETGPGRLPRP